MPCGMDETTDWITEKQAAALLDCDQRTLAAAVLRGDGPPAYRGLAPKRRRYKRHEVLAFLESTRIVVAPAEGAA